MLIINVRPIPPKLTASGATIEAHFDISLEGVTCRNLALAKAPAGDDLIWSTRSPRGPTVTIAKRARAEIAAAVRAELAALAAVLRAA